MIDERTRHELFLRLEEVLGAEEAATLMEHLPPVGWADVATKHDLESLRILMKQDLDALGMRIEASTLAIRVEMRGEINRLLLWLFPTLLTVVGLGFAAGHLSLDRNLLPTWITTTRLQNRPGARFRAMSPSTKSPLHVTVTGAAGQIGYALVHRIASGQLLGPDQPIVLRLLEIEPAMKSLEGLVMELEDEAHPLLEGIVPTSSLQEAFDGTSWALLVGSIPRKAGMERGDLLKVNGGIFGPQGQAINDHAADDVRVLVVGNPCNTNCLIARSHAPDVPADRWFAMTRLDENRAKAQLAKKAGVLVKDVSNVAIWGNHSATQFPDFAHAKISGKPATDVIGDADWLEAEFIVTVQKRGAAVIEARGSSSAASAAHAAIESVQSVWQKTPGDDWHSLAVASNGEYGAPEGLQFGYPVRSDGSSWSIVEGIEHDDFAKSRIKITTDELLSERDEVRSLGLIPS